MNEAWQECQKKYSNRSELELAAEQRERERKRALQGFKKPATQAKRDEQARRFKAISAQNELDSRVEQDSIIAEREKEVSALITSALEVATPTEAATIRAQVFPQNIVHALKGERSYAGLSLPISILTLLMQNRRMWPHI